MYLARCLEVVGQDVYLWNDPNMSAFDIFDSFKPDVFLSHYQFLTEDQIKYLSRNKNIQCILNVTGVDSPILTNIENAFRENGVNCPFVFTNAHTVLPQPKADKLKVHSILPGVDVFLAHEEIANFKLDVGVIATEPSKEIEEYVSNKDTYHLLKLTVSPERDKNFDIPVNIMSLRSLYSHYKEILFATGMNLVFSQIFYEAIGHADKVTFKLMDEEEELWNKYLLSLFKEEEGDISDVLKGQIFSRHTCVRRAARFCRYLKDSETKSKLEKLDRELMQVRRT